MSGLTHAQTVWQWVAPFNSNGNVISKSVVAEPASGDNFTTGYTTGDLSNVFTFNQNGTPDFSTTLGTQDGFVAKHDVLGQFVWAFRIGSPGATVDVRGIDIDGSGNLYITGSFSGTNVDFKGVNSSSSATLNSNSGTTDAFLAKYNPAGELLWVVQGSCTDEAIGNSVATNGSMVVVTGNFKSAVLNLSGGMGLSNTDGRDVFLAGYDLNGNQMWERRAGNFGGSSGDEYGNDIAVNSNQVFIIGDFVEDMRFFDPIAGPKDISPVVAGKQSIFIAGYDIANGKLSWANRISGQEVCMGNGIATYGTGIAITGGIFDNGAPVEFPGIAPFPLGGNKIEIFTALLDTTTGSPVTDWVNPVLNTNALDCYGMDIHYDQNTIYAVGSFRGTANFNGGLDPITASNRSIYVVSYDNLGNFQWVKDGGSSGPDEGCGISVDGQDGVFVAGSYDKAASFDTITAPDAPGDNGFVGRIGDCSTLISTGNATVSSDTICPGDSIDLILTGHFGLIQWEESYDEGATWTSIPIAVGDSVRYPPLQDSALFRAEIYFPGCTGDYSDTVFVFYENTPPTITCPPDQTEYVDNNCEFLIPDYTGMATVIDNCPGYSVTQSPVPGSIVGTGIAVINLIVTDTVGLTATCSFNVDVLDTITPTTSCPADITVNNDPGVCGATVTWVAPTVTDNCPGSTVNQSTGMASGSVFPVGVSLIEYTETDASGNSATCSFNITVTDNEPPNVICPPGTIEYVNTNCLFNLPDYTSLVIASDNCGMASVNQSPIPGTAVGLGVHNITVTGIDVNGNSSSCSFNITVEDTISPQITCPPDQTEYVNNNCEFILPNYTGLATTSDNCGSPMIAQSPAPGTVLNNGVAGITLVSTDAAGNSSQCMFNVMVLDTVSPQLNCPVDQTEYVDANCEFVLPDYRTLALGTDNCSAVSMTQTPSPGTTISTGTTTINIAAQDTSGNSSNCSFVVDVLDTISPSITCPATQVEYVDQNCEFQVPDYRPLATVADNCLLDTTMQSPAPGTILSVGISSIDLTVVDSSGNSSVCSFSVDVLDTIPPGFISCPSNIISCDSVVSWASPTGIDSCGVVTITQTQGSPSGSTFPVGISAIEYVVSDPSGNTDTCSFTVEILPVIDPIFFIPDTLCVYSLPIDLSDSLQLNPGETDTFYTVPSVILSGGTVFDPSTAGTGVFDIVHVVDNGVCVDSSITTATVLPPPDMSMSQPDTVCASIDTVQLNTWFTATTDPSGHWIGSAVMNDSVWVMNGMSGYYDLSYVAGISPCLDTLDLTVYVAPDVDPSWTAPGPFCDVDTLEYLADDINGTLNGRFSGTGIIQSNFDPTVGPGTFVITYGVGEGMCKEFRDDSIVVVISPIADAGPDVEVCDTLAQMAANAMNGTGTWQFNSLVTVSDSSATNPTASVPGQGQYSLVWEVTNSICTIRDTADIVAWDYPTMTYGGDDQDLDYRFDTQMNADYPVPATAYGVWGLAGGSGEFYDVNDPQTMVEGLQFGDNTFTWTVNNGNCAAVVDTVVVHVNELVVPSGFSPNGDNINDRFVVPGLENASTSELTVINRWGNRVFIDSDYRNNWDGRNNKGSDLPEDTYFYELLVDEEYVFSGYVVIKR